jgi:hypothetical protein
MMRSRRIQMHQRPPRLLVQPQPLVERLPELILVQLEVLAGQLPEPLKPQMMIAIRSSTIASPRPKNSAMYVGPDASRVTDHEMVIALIARPHSPRLVLTVSALLPNSTTSPPSHVKIRTSPRSDNGWISKSSGTLVTPLATSVWETMKTTAQRASTDRSLESECLSPHTS